MIFSSTSIPSHTTRIVKKKTNLELVKCTQFLPLCCNKNEGSKLKWLWVQWYELYLSMI